MVGLYFSYICTSNSLFTGIDFIFTDIHECITAKSVCLGILHGNSIKVPTFEEIIFIFTLIQKNLGSGLAIPGEMFLSVPLMFH